MAVTYRLRGEDGPTFELVDDDDLVVVRTARRGWLANAPLSRGQRSAVASLRSSVAFTEAGVETFDTVGASAAEVRAQLAEAPAIEFAGRGLRDPGTREPVVYTENVFVQFRPDVSRATVLATLERYELAIKRPISYAPNAYFVAAPAGTGRAVFERASDLLDDSTVLLCHPELARARALKVEPRQWHLQPTTIDGTWVEADADVVAAWQVARGAGITIAVIDDGFDLDHPELSGPGKVVSPRDVTRDNASPVPGLRDHHGTACAGVACAAGEDRAWGTAPAATLMPIRLASGLGTQDEADAFAWAADHGADVISCSWGPVDGAWWDPNDPTHDAVVPLPDSTRVAIDHALTTGRQGRGCVITWAAGNGNESVDNDGYASYEPIIAVAACNDRSERAAYSDMGEAIWCTFPSSHGEPSLTNGIWTTDRLGAAGYNSGANPADPSGAYTDDFGGTSSACPGAAGVVALMLEANGDLTHTEVKALLAQSCDKIDPDGGNYDERGHSPLYGYGRVNAVRAVSAARGAAGGGQGETAVFEAPGGVVIPVQGSVDVPVAVDARDGVVDVRVHVEIDHSWIGDLVLELVVPGGAEPIELWRTDPWQSGGSIRQLFTTATTPALGEVVTAGALAGTWTLRVTDRADLDGGVVRRFALELRY
ncbi:MAG: S8 family serine peptidase [Actinomycetota bacterium]|nr:S8 family serine peptidase [Actinomycetota bacterium]